MGGGVVRVGLKTFKAPYTGRALNSSEETRDSESINISSKTFLLAAHKHQLLYDDHTFWLRLCGVFRTNRTKNLKIYDYHTE